MSEALVRLTAVETAAMVRSRQVKAEEVASAVLDRIRNRDQEVGAWAYVDPDLVMRRARALDAQPEPGPLAGVPFAVKDIIDTADEPTQYGTPIHQGRQANRDAACVALTRRAGGLLIGKAVTTEFANVSPGKTRNPLDLSRTPGGSSSGSAAAVADHTSALALGTQTTGSTTRPASYCGIFGYRPTYGELRMSGVMEAAGSFDTLGILTRSLEDVVRYRRVLLASSAATVEAPRPRIGFCRPYFWSRLDQEVRDLLSGVADRLSEAGAMIDEVELPGRLEEAETAHRWVAGFEMARNLTWEIEHHFEEISPRLREGRIKDGLATTYETYVEMLNLLRQLRAETAPVFDRYDILVAPAAAREAPEGWDPVPDPWVHMMWTALHVPSITMPVLTGGNGLPIGVQLIGRWHGDDQLLAQTQYLLDSLTTTTTSKEA